MFRPAEILQLRYLTENSMGNGIDKRSVIHAQYAPKNLDGTIWYEQTFVLGRIKRSALQLLCGRKGKFDISAREDKSIKEVNCLRCIEILVRMG